MTVLRYGLGEETLILYSAHFISDVDLTFSPIPGHGPWNPNAWKESKPYRVHMVKI